LVLLSFLVYTRQSLQYLMRKLPCQPANAAAKKDILMVSTFETPCIENCCWLRRKPTPIF
jgi:hypothetical protein